MYYKCSRINIICKKVYTCIKSNNNCVEYTILKGLISVFFNLLYVYIHIKG